ncbi:hypothetical protein UFOVP1254_19 [uncultured Caudovirales phage]|uniref:Uncharacterized protein n=1 Tax=uncultured Caudovirales phage TaxID=2100421 RepID=A0A6J5REH3_9CAUD|nr:hypothetical protein UFOVP1254_19 [uncultured Caudovirales phage]
MNYSQRKYLEKLMQFDAFKDDFDPFGIRPARTLFGLDIVTPPDVPRYTLPKELMPGVPWPPGFRDDFNNWSRNFLGTTNVLPRGMAHMIGNRHVVMHPDDVVKISGL